MKRDHVFQLHDGWYCIVGGKVFGAWECRGYAVAGLKTEQRRRLKRAA